MLCNGAQCQRWKKCQRGKNVYDENQDNGKRNRVRPQRAGRFIDKVLFHQRPGNGQLDDDGKVSAEEHGQLVYEFKRNTAVRDTAPLDYWRDENAPVGYLPKA